MELQTSAGGMIYTLDHNREPSFLLLKRYTMSKTIERVAPKGKIQAGETLQQTAVREVNEEVGIVASDLIVRDEIGELWLDLTLPGGPIRQKVVTFFLMQYLGEQDAIDIQDGEGFLGYHKRASIDELLGLIHYENLREMFRKSYHLAKQYHGG